MTRKRWEGSDVRSQSSLSLSRKTGNRQGYRIPSLVSYTHFLIENSLCFLFTFEFRKKDGVSYAMMIETAINAKGGRARYSDIISYIEEHFKDVISTRRTWKNSIGGTHQTHKLTNTPNLSNIV
jgi:hypothetical protein